MDFNPISEDPVKLDNNYPTLIDGFTCDSNNSKLMGTIYVAQGKGPHPTVLLLHGIPGYEQNSDIAHVLLRTGYNVVIFHYRGNWGSEGTYSIGHIFEDIENVIEFLKCRQSVESYRVDSKNIILIGHSLGGFSALMAASNHPEIKLVASIAGFNFGLYGEIISANNNLVKSAIENFEFIKSPVIKGITPTKFVEEIIEHRKKWNILNIIKKLKGHSVLMIGGIRDNISPIEQNFKLIVEALEKERVDFKEVLLDGDHCFSDKRIVLTKEILKWLQVYIRK
ncbi:alpha/beta hydrolase family protein [Clostridium kluyveri]|uniref:AB hydrolase-1 domain-containing protein n=1 Tax=Clostridium kluyveri TaxID=1534 RepID=A0A1L5F7J5_CLOKL|nr:alpha/beta fold hydrolase [Clostridium kluyveri]APM38942.1 hypothetical protein BS101_09395 [Clostridium kluyveri]UZQ51265.1 alpha/beta fold hydrolase [Clostridium kluyveri]